MWKYISQLLGGSATIQVEQKEEQIKIEELVKPVKAKPVVKPLYSEVVKRVPVVPSNQNQIQTQSSQPRNMFTEKTPDKKAEDQEDNDWALVSFDPRKPQ